MLLMSSSPSQSPLLTRHSLPDAEDSPPSLLHQGRSLLKRQSHLNASDRLFLQPVSPQLVFENRNGSKTTANTTHLACVQNLDSSLL